mgnify:CR=1 FL=1
MKEIIGFIICICLLYKVPMEILDEFAFIVTAVTLLMWLTEVAASLIDEFFKKRRRKKR